MNKYLELSLVLAASSTMASEVLVGSAVGFNANTDTANHGHVGVVLNAEHHRSLTRDTGYFVASNVYVAPAIISEDAPVSAGLVVGGTVKSAVSPVSAQIGLSIDMMNTASGSVSKYQIAPGVMVGGIYNLTNEWALKTASTIAFPSNKFGVYSSADFTSSIGVSRTIPVDA